MGDWTDVPEKGEGMHPSQTPSQPRGRNEDERRTYGCMNGIPLSYASPKEQGLPALPGLTARMSPSLAPSLAGKEDQKTWARARRRKHKNSNVTLSRVL